MKMQWADDFHRGSIPGIWILGSSPRMTGGETAEPSTNVISGRLESESGNQSREFSGLDSGLASPPGMTNVGGAVHISTASPLYLLQGAIPEGLPLALKSTGALEGWIPVTSTGMTQGKGYIFSTCRPTRAVEAPRYSVYPLNTSFRDAKQTRNPELRAPDTFGKLNYDFQANDISRAKIFLQSPEFRKFESLRFVDAHYISVLYPPLGSRRATIRRQQKPWGFFFSSFSKNFSNNVVVS